MHYVERKRNSDKCVMYLSGWLEFHYPEISLPLCAVEGLMKCFARILQERSAAYEFFFETKNNRTMAAEKRLKQLGQR